MNKDYREQVEIYREILRTVAQEGKQPNLELRDGLVYIVQPEIPKRVFF